MGGEKVKLNKKLIVLLAVFMLVLSAGAVSADDTTQADDDAEDIEVTSTVDADNEDGDVNDIEVTATAGAYDAADDADETDDDTDEETDDETDDGEYNETEEGLLADAVYAEGDDSASASAPEKTTSNLDDNVAGNPALILLTAIAGIGLTTLKRKY